jgi:tetratricopeptide (TPR) repeat protein
MLFDSVSVRVVFSCHFFVSCQDLFHRIQTFGHDHHDHIASCGEVPSIGIPSAFHRHSIGFCRHCVSLVHSFMPFLTPLTKQSTFMRLSRFIGFIIGFIDFIAVATRTAVRVVVLPSVVLASLLAGALTAGLTGCSAPQGGINSSSSASSASSGAGQTGAAQAGKNPKLLSPTFADTPVAPIVNLLAPGKEPDFLKSPKARDYFVRGSTLQMQDRPAEAILEFLQALRYDSAAPIHFAIAQNYAKIGKPDLAQESALAAIRLDSAYLPPFRLMAESYVAQYRIDDAIVMMKYIVAREPSVQDRFTLARLYELRDPEVAIALYSSLLDDLGKDNPNEQLVLARLVDLQAKQGKAGQAALVLEKLRAKYPDNNSYAAALMEAYLYQKHFDKAFELAESSEPRFTEPEAINLWLIYGDAVMQQFDSVQQAKAYAETFLAKAEARKKSGFTDSAPFQMLCGMIAGNLGRKDQSRYYFDRTVTLSDSAALALQISVFYYTRRQLAEMGEFSSKAARRFPTDARLSYMAGFAFSQTDSTRRAIVELQRAVSIDERYVDAWLQLGLLYSSSGQTLLSDSAYERVLVLDPDNALVNNNYAYSFSERKINLDRAEKMTLIALKSEPKNPSYLDTMGWVYYQQGKYDKALDYISQAIENGDSGATIHEHLGDVYQQLGNMPKAVEAWKESLRKDPQRGSAKERLARFSAK